MQRLYWDLAWLIQLLSSQVPEWEKHNVNICAMLKSHAG